MILDGIWLFAAENSTLNYTDGQTYRRAESWTPNKCDCKTLICKFREKLVKILNFSPALLARFWFNLSARSYINN